MTFVQHYCGELAYRRRFEPAWKARYNAGRMALYATLRGLIDWIEPPTATSYRKRS